MKASIMIERLQKMIENKGDVEVIVMNKAGSHNTIMVDSCNEGMTGAGLIFIQTKIKRINETNDKIRWEETK